MAPTLKPLDRPLALSDQVYDTLRDYLGSHRIRPGQRLQEANLAAQLGVSRTPVREALARLASEGMIAAEGRGFVVPALTDADIEEIYELRYLLEPAAVSQVANALADPRALAPLTAALEAAVAAERSGATEAFMEANSRFHAAWRALVPNRRLTRALDLYIGHVRYLRVLTLGDLAARKAALAGMKAILAALRKRDGEAAARAMLEHLQRAKHFLRQAIDQINREAETEQVSA